VKRQVVRVSMGMGALIFFTLVDYRKLAPYSLWACLFFFVLLMLVYFPGIGIEAGGGRRWVNLYFRIQPSEYFKIFYVLFLAHNLASVQDRLKEKGYYIVGAV